MTMAEHATILGMIFSPNHTGSRMVKRLAEINLINGDEEAAMKYLRILSNTRFYNQWAKDRIPGKESETVKQWLKNKQAFIPQSDTIRISTTDVAKSLRLLLESNPDNGMARDYLLCLHLLAKNLPGFLEDYVGEAGKSPQTLICRSPDDRPGTPSGHRRRDTGNDRRSFRRTGSKNIPGCISNRKETRRRWSANMGKHTGSIIILHKTNKGE